MVRTACAFVAATTFLSCQPATAQDSPITTCGPAFPEAEKANQILVAFQQKYALPGVSIAISYNNRLVFASACGYSDVENRVKLTPTCKMRIASVTKPITATAIMKLVENKRLKLDDPVFGENAILGCEYGMPTYEGKPAQITLRNLLTHTSGGWGNSKNDPMFSRKTRRLNGGPLIEKVLRDFPLSHPPGSTYEYSNFGYYVLGRVIEHLSGKPYERYVKESVLEPCGITGMAIGSLSQKQDETRYYAAGAEDPNFCSPLHMDAHGGWISNPTDLLKFLAGINLFENSTRILSDQSIRAMTSPTDISPRYGFGLSVNARDNWWHMGSLPGTASEIGRSADGFCWAILTNHRPANDLFSSDLDRLFWQIKKQVKTWPLGTPLGPTNDPSP